MTVAVPPARILKLDRPHRRGLSEDQAATPGWNLADFESHCDERLDAVRTRCRTLLSEALAEAEELKERARADGLAAGRAAGLQDAEDRIAEAAAQEADRIATQRLQSTVPAVEKLRTAYAAELERRRADWERELVELACAIANRLIGRELSTDPTAAGELAAEALAAASGCRQPRAAMHPDDLAALGKPFEEELLGALGDGAGLVADASLARGDCVIRVAGGEIDGRLSSRLDRLAAELLPPAEGDSTGDGEESTL
ncbi:MAG: FliH/SctL family protein [Planctomycetota bacterium]